MYFKFSLNIMFKQAHLYIRGDVIGVGFRAWTKYQAKKTGVCGWVRNVYNHPEIFDSEGGVEVLIQGDNKRIEQMIDLLKEGPPVSRVEAVEVFYEEPKETYKEFEIRR